MDQTLMMLLKDVRGKTLRILEGLTDAQAQFAAPGLQNSILWHAGHALVVVEHLGVAAMSGAEPSYPKGWFEKFSWQSKPATVTEWPSVGEVRGELEEQLGKLSGLIETASDAELDKVVDVNRNRTLRYSVMHGLHDEAGHQGEMWVLRKMLGKK